ncbi:DUF4845 domain-containing protein [Halochromatium roseum]|uniref:DUF4845 domain-containing protein n=1 Tax=Halochromatium roseum TaxID=391920 RepID=UPI001914572D|nr:DUF4845 domain-containing protein [Halochromatium roseum]MBK5941699.1 hypothetical protein [Halochromatium roseum]
MNRPMMPQSQREPKHGRPAQRLARLRRGEKHARLPGPQRGFGLGKVLVVLLLVVFFVSLGIKMAPSYLTYFQVRNIMERVVERPELAGAGSRAILAAVTRQLGIDAVSSVDAKDFHLSREGEDTLLNLDYQVQQHVGFNVDVLMHFEHSVVLP